jgi:hypothetical protein
MWPSSNVYMPSDPQTGEIASGSITPTSAIVGRSAQQRERSLENEVQIATLVASTIGAKDGKSLDPESRHFRTAGNAAKAVTGLSYSKGLP